MQKKELYTPSKYKEDITQFKMVEEEEEEEQDEQEEPDNDYLIEEI